jgi:peptidyl-prolyl cis-trans isomerase B (cyclophilin B)
MERRIARQAEHLRRRRQAQAAVGAGLAVVLIVVGIVWLTGGFSHRPKPAASQAASCVWHPKSADDAKGVKATGLPPDSGEERSGSTPMTIRTNLGEIDVQVSRELAPCTAASFSYLAAKKYFDGSTCHRITTSGIYVLQCGDPYGTGGGGPAYSFANEYVPPAPTPTSSAGPTPATAPIVTYPKGTVAMAHSKEADSNGSQFFIVYQDSALPADYTVFGQVTKGLDVVLKVAKAGAVDGAGKVVGDGAPKTKITIVSLTMGEPAGAGTPATAATNG